MATPLVTIFAVIGFAFSAYGAYKVLAFIYVYLPWIHNSDIARYLWPERPYSLVTGATDGIGKALATELASRGFNLVLHGRNEEKLLATKQEIEARCPGIYVQALLADANQREWDFNSLLAKVKDLDITVLANVVGGTDVFGGPIDTYSPREADEVISRNALFPLHLTQALLPTLRSRSLRGPVKVISLGSMGALAVPPRLLVYAASKSFLENFMRGLAIDERFEASLGGVPNNLTFKFMQVGRVVSASNPVLPEWDMPSSSSFARDIVNRIDVPGRYVYPNIAHAFIGFVIWALGESVAEGMAASAIRAALTRQRSDPKRWH